MQRPLAVTLPVMIGLLFGGGIGGLELASWVAPGSIAANFVGLLALPLAFMAGLQLWLGFALLVALGQGLRRLLGRTREPLPAMDPREIPPGSYAFVVTSLGTMAVGGFVMGLLATRFGFLATLGLYVLVGLAYGVACWFLARSGFLPFPEEG